MKLSRSRNPASGSKAARAWPLRRRPRPQREGCPPPGVWEEDDQADGVELRPVQYVAISVLLYDAHVEIHACWDAQAGLDRPRRRRQLKLVLGLLEDVVHGDLYFGPSEAHELRRVFLALTYTTERERDLNTQTKDFIEVVREEAQKTRDLISKEHELTRLAIVQERDEESPVEAAERFLAEADRGG